MKVVPMMFYALGVCPRRLRFCVVIGASARAPCNTRGNNWASRVALRVQQPVEVHMADDEMRLAMHLHAHVSRCPIACVLILTWNVVIHRAAPIGAMKKRMRVFN